MLGLPGDLDPLIPGILPESADPAGLGCCALGVIGELVAQRGQLTHYNDLLAVRADLHFASEPAVRQPSREPRLGVVCRWQVSLLPATATVSPTLWAHPLRPSSSHHDFFLSLALITTLHMLQSERDEFG
jgi:hypothetical protein